LNASYLESVVLITHQRSLVESASNV